MVQLGRLRRKHRLDVAEAFAIGQLREGHRAKVFGARKRADPVVAMVTLDDAGEGRPGKKIHQLREKGLACVHDAASGNVFPESRLKPRPRSSRHHKKMLISIV